MTNRKSQFLLAAFLAFAGCGESRSTATTATAEPAASAAAGPACAPAPKLGVDAARFGDGYKHFAPGRPSRSELDGNFRKAYDAACKAGWLAKKPLMDRRAAHPGILYVTNVPDSVGMWIGFDAAADVPARKREMLMEGPLVGPDDEVFVPTVDELAEAIFCQVTDMSAADLAASGRCQIG